MTTIKSYSDLQQSKKLAEILPLESADMFHFIHEVETDRPMTEIEVHYIYGALSVSGID